MVNEQFERNIALIGEEAQKKLRTFRVALFGVGGVGSYVAEALARAGVGQIDLTDKDRVCPSNLNRQIIALHSTLGKLKVDAAKERILDICPDTRVETHAVFFLPENADEFDFSVYDYVIDAIDTVSGKIAIIEKAKASEVPVISCMGTAGKTDPLAFRIADVSKSSVCPLARVMRYELKKRGIKNVKVLFSTEAPKKPSPSYEGEKPPLGTMPFVPSAAGLLIAREVIFDLLKKQH